MVSWGFAFKKGFIIFLWSIVWGIIGGIITMVIGGSSIVLILTNPSNSNAWIGGLALMVIGSLIGSLIAAVLVFATILKITMESTLEEARKPPAP